MFTLWASFKKNRNIYKAIMILITTDVTWRSFEHFCHEQMFLPSYFLPTFHIFRASTSGNRLILCSSGKSYDGSWSSKIVKGSVRPSMLKVDTIKIDEFDRTFHNFGAPRSVVRGCSMDCLMKDINAARAGAPEKLAHYKCEGLMSCCEGQGTMAWKVCIRVSSPGSAILTSALLTN